MAAIPPSPRRQPAHKSVSLLHGQQRRRSPRQESCCSSGDSNSPSSLQPLGKASSGESSNADQWFDNSNNEAAANNRSFADNDPPFFLRNNSSSHSPPEPQQQQQQHHGTGLGSLPGHMGLVRMETEGSSTEDYRGVIDDLTVENKKLKRRLKKYEKLHDAHLRDEKLFEVRFHGLSQDKKLELEATLQKFAAGLGSNGFPANEYDGLMPPTANKVTSPARNTDSAYASNSASGRGSSSAQSAADTRSGISNGQKASLRRNNAIHSYLHHMPEGLLPQTNPSNMTERAKQKLVVRRLEQIFAGKGAALHGHQHPQQQQEVSQMAARADKAQSDNAGQPIRREGIREAHIMTKEGEEMAELADSTAPRAHGSPLNPGQENKSPEHTFTQKPEGEQRPTRPLDLDLHRAQVPADNMRYIRHLGFASSGQHSPSISEEGQGWVYLNLLINMAQLHTINVTTEFVRKAVATRSSNFEVSADGRKVRWKGGSSITRGSSITGGSSATSHNDVDTPDDQSPRKRPKFAHQDSYRSQASIAENKLVYTPMFWNRSSSDEMDYTSEEDEDMSTPGQAPIAGDASGLTSAGIHTVVPRKRQRADGPIIFYQNARFCTDLSGDPGAQYNRNAPLYSPSTEIAIGESQGHSSGFQAEKRGPLTHVADLPMPMSLNDNSTPESKELSFPSPSEEAALKEDMQPINLEASGIGGVWPADNLFIEVESRHVKHEQGGRPHNPHRQYLSTQFATLWPSSVPASSFSPTVSNEIVKSVQTHLPPSELPPALCFVSQSDDYESGGDEASTSPISGNGSVPSAMPQPVRLHYVGSEEEDDQYDDDVSDEESDGSVDMLAAAREMDPEAIRLREREYDANMAERLAEEIPAGSSAATAGGGSGFASPAHGMSGEEYQKALAEHRARRGMPKRSATADSMKVLVQGARASSSDGEDNDEDEDEDMDMDDVAS